MNTLHTLSRTLLATILLGVLATPSILLAQSQTNDPLVDEQQYLFDVHRIGQDWTYTTGSSDVKIGIYSMFGFTQSHEDLSDNRLAPPEGNLLRPKLDISSQMAGIVGASTNNGVGMTGIDQEAQLQSYSVLRNSPECTQLDCKKEEPITIDFEDGTSETFYLNIYRFSENIESGRENGVDVHLLSYGLPSAYKEDYSSDDPEITNPMNLTQYSPPADWREAFRDYIFPELKEIAQGPLCGTPFLGIAAALGLSDCGSDPNPYKLFSEELGFAVSRDGAVVVDPAGDLNASGDSPPQIYPWCA